MAAILIAFLLFLPFEVCGENLGVFGRCYEVSEENLKEHLLKKLSAIDPGKRIAISQEIDQKYSHSLIPNPIEGLERAKEKAIRYFDPSTCMTHTIKDHEGNVIVQAGEYLNPLDKISLNEPLVFFDGDDDVQVAWAKRENVSSKWILTRGNPFELEEKEWRPVFFDQCGFLVNYFGIKYIPSRILQEGRKLKIEEVCL